MRTFAACAARGQEFGAGRGQEFGAFAANGFVDGRDLALAGPEQHHPQQETQREGRPDAGTGETPAARGEPSAVAAGDGNGQTPAFSEADMNRMIEELCESKAEEFRLLGYEQVTGADIWECVSDGYRKTGMPPLYAVVNDILSLKVTQYMNFITLNLYRGERR